MLKALQPEPSQYLKGCKIPSKGCARIEGIVTMFRGIRWLEAGKRGGRRARRRALPARAYDLPDGPEEAAALIAETAISLADLARRHELEMLHHLLAMVQLEAEEHIRLRSKRKLS